jgi:hypothetical protein
MKVMFANGRGNVGRRLSAVLSAVLAAEKASQRLV